MHSVISAVWIEMILGPHRNKMRSILDVCEQFHRKGNAKRAFLYTPINTKGIQIGCPLYLRVTS